jgi:hypothetical protein
VSSARRTDDLPGLLIVAFRPPVACQPQALVWCLGLQIQEKLAPVASFVKPLRGGVNSRKMKMTTPELRVGQEKNIALAHFLFTSRFLIWQTKAAVWDGQQIEKKRVSPSLTLPVFMADSFLDVSGRCWVAILHFDK